MFQRTVLALRKKETLLKYFKKDSCPQNTENMQDHLLRSNRFDSKLEEHVAKDKDVLHSLLYCLVIVFLTIQKTFIDSISKNICMKNLSFCQWVQTNSFRRRPKTYMCPKKSLGKWVPRKNEYELEESLTLSECLSCNGGKATLPQDCTELENLEAIARKVLRQTYVEKVGSKFI